MRSSTVTRAITAVAAMTLAVGLACAAAASPAAASPAAASSAAVSDASTARPVTPVPSVDLVRYQGVWRQFASIPQPFEAECARDVTARYTILPDGLVEVINTCVRSDGSVTGIEGRAKPAAPGSTSTLLVTFVQVGGEWQFQAAANYWVIGLAPDYRWAVVGGPDRGSGFVLSRTPTLTLSDVGQVLTVLLRNGYDPCRFRITPTTGGIPVPIGPCD